MRIQIKNLRITALIGVHEWEKNRPQELIINAALDYDASDAAASDRLKDAIDYQAITRRLAAIAHERRHKLLETLAQKMLDSLLADERITYACVEIDKPGALALADSVSVKTERRAD